MLCKGIGIVFGRAQQESACGIAHRKPLMGRRNLWLMRTKRAPRLFTRSHHAIFELAGYHSLLSSIFLVYRFGATSS